MKHLCIPIKRWWFRRWLCIHCSDLSRVQDSEGCLYVPGKVPHDGMRCHPDAPCTCPCNLCRKFPNGDT